MDRALKNIIEGLSESFIGEINSNMRETKTDATGKTSAGFYYKISDRDGQPIVDILNRRPYAQSVEKGRGPGKISTEMVENIKDWCDVRGKEESLAWAIAKTIEKKGTKLYQKGGRTDIYTDISYKFVDEVADATTKYYADKLLKSLKL